MTIKFKIRVQIELMAMVMTGGVGAHVVCFVKGSPVFCQKLIITKIKNWKKKKNTNR